MKTVYTQILVTAALSGALAAGCATRGQVRSRVAEVNDKVESVSQSLEKTQERVKQNADSIGKLDQTVDKTQQDVQAAQTAANQAADASQHALQQAQAVERQQKQIVSEVVLSEDAGGFKFDQARLSDQAKSSLDQIVQDLRAKPDGSYIEIEGYTDSTGPKAYNEELGLERAEAAKEYLHEHDQVPLHKISVISYGAEKPVAPNTTRAGRAQNRRIVVRVVR